MELKLFVATDVRDVWVDPCLQVAVVFRAFCNVAPCLEANRNRWNLSLLRGIIAFIKITNTIH
jgi:hypothetical protein